MVSIIPRHPFPTENAEAGLAVLQESVDGWIDGLEADSTGLGEAFDTSLMLAKGTACWTREDRSSPPGTPG